MCVLEYLCSPFKSVQTDGSSVIFSDGAEEKMEKIGWEISCRTSNGKRHYVHLSRRMCGLKVYSALLVMSGISGHESGQNISCLVIDFVTLTLYLSFVLNISLCVCPFCSISLYLSAAMSFRCQLKIYFFLSAYPPCAASLSYGLIFKIFKI